MIQFQLWKKCFGSFQLLFFIHCYFSKNNNSFMQELLNSLQRTSSPCFSIAQSFLWNIRLSNKFNWSKFFLCFSNLTVNNCSCEQNQVSNSFCSGSRNVFRLFFIQGDISRALLVDQTSRRPDSPDWSIN